MPERRKTPSPAEVRDMHQRLGNSTTLTPDQVKWLMTARPDDLEAYLNATGDAEKIRLAEILCANIAQDMERRYIFGYNNLWSSEE